MSTSSEGQTWHPVAPRITDPALKRPEPVGEQHGPAEGGLPAQIQGQVAAGGQIAPPGDNTGKGFFAQNKLAIILSVVVLLIFIVILYVYLTRRGENKKSAADKDKSDQGGGQATETVVDMNEVNRLRALRQHQKRRPRGNPSHQNIAHGQRGPPHQAGLPPQGAGGLPPQGAGLPPQGAGLPTPVNQSMTQDHQQPPPQFVGPPAQFGFPSQQPQFRGTTPPSHHTPAQTGTPTGSVTEDARPAPAPQQPTGEVSSSGDLTSQEKSDMDMLITSLEDEIGSGENQ
jgi:hypothetical protein